LTSRSWLIETAIVVAIVVCGAAWGTRFWNTWVSRGNDVQFYQAYFEPAVMIACGHGFVVSPAQPPALGDFLNRRRDRFACSEIPAEAARGGGRLYQGPWRYLMTTVGWFWRARGISWSGMGPLFGLFFGVTLALAYGVCRLGMGRVASVLVVLALSVSTAHLINLPHLRDYSKAPFTLALAFVLGLLVICAPRRKTMLAVAVAYGAIAGIGYGFRTDLLANLPAFLIVLFVFAPGGIARNLALKTAAAATFLASFLVVSWPVASTVYSAGGCQWHVVLIGLQRPFDEQLRIRPAPYDFGTGDSDQYIASAVSAFAQESGDGPDIGFCSHTYDVESGRYLRMLAVNFPADVAARALAATAQVVDIPFHWLEPPLRNWHERFYYDRLIALRVMDMRGAYLAAAAIMLAGAVSIRVALFLLFFALYFGGYPAAQFQLRHYFHLEFVPLWAVGFVVEACVRSATTLAREGMPRVADVVPGVARVALVAAVMAAALFLPLTILRWYQQREAKALLSAYLGATKEPLAAAVSARHGRNGEVVEVDLNPSACRVASTVTFRYDSAHPVFDFTWTAPVPNAGLPGLTRMFVVVFDHFTALEFSDPRPECMVGAYRLTGARPIPIVLDATLTPGWERLPLYQRVGRWERADR